MNRHKAVWVTVLVACLLFWMGIAAALARASVLPGGTCVPQSTVRDGVYRVDNDAPFAGLAGSECVIIDGTTITLGSSLPAQRGIVVGYPNIRYGPKFGSLDPGAILPLRVGQLDELTLHVTARGKAGGHWLSDVDAWVYPDQNTRNHGASEIVIGVRWKGWHAGYMRAAVGGRIYLVARWTTGGGGQQWPLTIFRPLHRARSVSLPMGPFMRFMLHHRWLRRGDWLGNVAFGTEIWGGGQGLRDGMTVTAAQYKAPS